MIDVNAICLVIDGLNSGYLGCYGNASISTPEFDRLASESFLLDQAFIDSPTSAGLYRASWSEIHALEPQSFGRAPLPDRLARAGIATTLITDGSSDELPYAGEHAEQIHLRLARPHQPADDAGQTQLAAFFAAACDWLSSPREPFCLWLDSSSLATCWDAPLEFRNRYADEDEPLPPPVVEVPRLVLPPGYDPDQLLGYAQSYAGQITLLDQCLGGLTDYLRSSALATNTLLVVMGSRGLALGEHRRVGAWYDALCEELIHAPWVMRFPDGLGHAARSQALVQPPDLAATLADWWQLEADTPHEPGRFARSLLPLARDEVLTWRDRACLVSPRGERGIRTRAWYLRTASEPLAGDNSQASSFLYAKPDDRFEANDVRARCEPIAEALEQGWAEFESLASTGQLDKLAPLDESLVAEMR